MNQRKANAIIHFRVWSVNKYAPFCVRKTLVYADSTTTPNWDRVTCQTCLGLRAAYEGKDP